MLDETKQRELAQITVKGSTDLPIHLQYRDKIREQQDRIERIHGTSINQAITHTSTDIIDLVEESLVRIGLDRFGITSVLDEYTFKNSNIKEHTAIVIVTPMNYDAMITAPSLKSATEILRSYYMGGKAVLEVTKTLRENGVQASAHHPLGDNDQYHHLLFPPHAVEASLGEKGRTGLFIDYVYGPLVRLALVTVDADLPHTEKQKKGITDFCHRCRYCVDYCPPNALPDGKNIDAVLSGEPMEFKINAHRCFKYFEKYNGCGRCIVNCILAEPELDDVKRRMERIERWYQKWIVSGKLEEMHKKELQLHNK